MQAERKTRASQAGKTRYVFAGTERHEEEGGVKTCPRCGQMLFEDMDVCYGCLYDFSRDCHGTARVPDDVGRAALEDLRALSQAIDPLDTIELDEIDEDEEPLRVPRHSKEATQLSLSPDDTLDLAQGPITQKLEPVKAAEDQDATWLTVSTADLLVKVPLPYAGITVGRDESNDIVLRDRSVSRRHVRVLRSEEGVLVEDLGATNPAKLGAVPVTTRLPMAQGDELDVCGTRITLA